MIQAPNDHDLVINLDGPDGNVFSLMGAAKGLAFRYGLAGRTPDIEFIMDEMKSGDYVNAIKTFDKYFGEYVILETRDEELLNA